MAEIQDFLSGKLQMLHTVWETILATKKMTDDEVSQMLIDANNAHPREFKVQISLRLDSDVFLELKRRAAQGAAGGKYQRMINEILRVALFEADHRSGIDMRALTKKVDAIYAMLRKSKPPVRSKPKKRT